MGTYHDHIIAEKQRLEGVDLIGPSSSLFNRYTRGIFQASPTACKIAYSLTVVQFSEVVFELLADKFAGSKRKWDVILYTEIVKCFLKVALFELSSHRVLLSPCVPERDPEHFGDKSDSTKISTGLSVETARAGDVTKYLLSRALTSGKRNVMV